MLAIKLKKNIEGDYPWDEETWGTRSSSKCPKIFAKENPNSMVIDRDISYVSCPGPFFPSSF